MDRTRGTGPETAATPDAPLVDDGRIFGVHIDLDGLHGADPDTGIALHTGLLVDEKQRIAYHFLPRFYFFVIPNYPKIVTIQIAFTYFVFFWFIFHI
jgi:hypothetical protein